MGEALIKSHLPVLFVDLAPRLQVWEAVQEMISAGSWKLKSIPSYIDENNEATLANGNPHNLGQLKVPKSPPCLAGKAGFKDIEASFMGLTPHVLPACRLRVIKQR